MTATKASGLLCSRGRRRERVASPGTTSPLPGPQRSPQRPSQGVVEEAEELEFVRMCIAEELRPEGEQQGPRCSAGTAEAEGFPEGGMSPDIPRARSGRELCTAAAVAPRTTSCSGRGVRQDPHPSRGGGKWASPEHEAAVERFAGARIPTATRNHGRLPSSCVPVAPTLPQLAPSHSHLQPLPGFCC